MTKQQIVVQLVAAKIANSVYVYDTDLINYGKLADKIMEMFPEPDYTVAGSPLTVSVAGWEADFDKYMAGVVDA